MELGEILCEGKTKRVYRTDEPGMAVMYFKDDALAFQGLKRGRIVGKGEVNNAICCALYRMLAQKGVENHFVRRLDNRHCVVRECEMIPLKIRVRNRVAGTLTELIDLPMGAALEPPVVEFLYKKSPMFESPLVNFTHIQAMGLATRAEMAQINETALRVNDILRTYMRGIGVELVDFKLEFGRCDGRVVVADEITPDNARFWDAMTHEPLDIDRFKRDLGNAEQAYRELLHRVVGMEE